jgi:quinoprotein glucose dehydrogenase
MTVAPATHRHCELPSLIIFFCLAFASSGASGQTSRRVEWVNYGNDPGGMRYSPLTQINRDNVAKLKLAWVYHTGDVSNGTGYPRKSEFESTPIFVDGTLYLTTAFNRIVALDPVSGKERWTFDPKINLASKYSEGLMNRGVSTWLDNRGKPGAPCRRRIFLAAIDARLIAVDAASGKPCKDFAAAGELDLTQGIVNIIRVGEYEETSPPGGVEVWRGGLGGAYPLPALSSAGASIAPPCFRLSGRTVARNRASNDAAVRVEESR